jgi:hypothetical protein
VLRWTIADKPTGPVSVGLRLRGEGIFHDVHARFSASAPFITPGFAADRLLAAPERPRVVAWEAPHPHDPAKRRTPIALIDVEARRLVGRAEIPFIRDLTSDGEHVAFVLDEADAFEVLGPPGLTRVARRLTPRRYEWIGPPLGGRVAAQPTGGVPPDLLDFPAMTEAADAPHRPRTPPWVAGGLFHLEGLSEAAIDAAMPRLHGVVLRRDGDRLQPALLAWPANLPIAMANPTGPRDDRLPASPYPARWGRLIAGLRLWTQTGQAAGMIEPPPGGPGMNDRSGFLVLSRYPVVAGVMREVLQDAVGPLARVRVAFWSVLDGRFLRAVNLDGPEDDLPPPDFPQGATAINLAEQGGTLLVADADRVYFLDLATVPELAAARVPLHFAPRQSAFVIDPAGATRLEHALSGGRPPYRFELAMDVPGATLDPDSGALTLDGPAAVRGALGRMDEALMALAREASGPVHDEADRVRSEVAAGFAGLVGRPPKGFPVLLPIIVKATDADGEQTALTYTVFVELPDAEYDEADARARAELRRRQGPP